jgi:hypothetical protein
MTTITVPRGDSRHIYLHIDEADGTNADLAEGVLRFAVKKATKESNDAAAILKTSYDADQIRLGDPGDAVIHVRIHDTISMVPRDYLWDVDFTRKARSKAGVVYDPVTAVGTLTLTAGSETIQVAGADMTLFRVGQVLEPAGQTRVVITAVDVEASTITCAGFSGWTSDTVAFELFHGERVTPPGLRGKFVVEADVVN